jgi:uncharacterized protein (TIGR00251 family)
MTAGRRDTALRALSPWIRIGRGAVTIEVLARPGASRTAVVRVEPRGIVIAVAAAADKGKANAELVRFIGKLADVGRASVEIVRGEASRSKVIRISTVYPAGVVARLSAAILQN